MSAPTPWSLTVHDDVPAADADTVDSCQTRLAIDRFAPGLRKFTVVRELAPVDER